MKTLSIILFTLVIGLNLDAQDKIFTKDSRELTVKILTQTNKLVTYRNADYFDGPVFSIKNSQIEKIEYKNGQIDLMGNQNPRHYRPFGINTGMMIGLNDEVAYYIVNMDYFITPQIDLQVNIGSEVEGGSYFSAGSRFHLNSNYSANRLTPFTGLLVGAEYGEGFIQVPVGVNYIGERGFNISLSVSEVFYPKDEWQTTFAELTLGWKFKL
ncbi:MAG: hypothetical protein ABFS16_10650 [Bacteroidota bacterium]